MLKNIIFLGICVWLNIAAVMSQTKVNLKIVPEYSSDIKPQFVKRIQGKYSNEATALRKMEFYIHKLRNKGYWEANVDSVQFADSEIHAYLHIGKKYSLDSWFHNGINSDFDSGYLIRLHDKKNINLKDLKLIQKRIVDEYNKKGYPFASINMDTIGFKTENFSGVWSLNKGDLIVWDSLEIKGGLKIRKQFLIKYLQLLPDKSYNENTIRSISKKINNLSFCKEIKPAEIEFVKGKAKVFTYLEKENSNRFDGIIGLQSNSNSDEKLSLTGEINLLLNNSFRAGEQLSFSWKKFGEQSQDLAVGFAYPYVISSIGADFNFELSKQDSTYLTTSLNAGFRILQRGNQHFKLFLNYQSSSLISTTHLSGVSVLPNYADVKSLLGGLGFKDSNLDYPFNPLKGWSADVNVSLGTHKIKKNRKIPEQLYDNIQLNSTMLKLNWKVENNMPLSPKLSYRIRNVSGILQSENLFVNDLFKIGGLNSLRGFDEDFFRASKFSVITNELRFVPERNTSFYLFADAAYYKSEVLDQSNEDFPFGLGFGLSFATKAGIFSLNYAVGKHKSQNIDLKNAKIHFGFISRF